MVQTLGKRGKAGRVTHSVGHLVQSSDRDDTGLDLERLGKGFVDALNGDRVERLEGLLERGGCVGEDLNGGDKRRDQRDAAVNAWQTK